MHRASQARVCTTCLHSLRSPATFAPASQPWLARSIHVQRGGSKPRPSRMVLSHQVHKAPSHGRKGAKDEGPGPWGGMNKTVANIRPRRGNRAAPQTRDARPEETSASAEAASSGGGGSGGRTIKGHDDKKALKMHRALASVSYNHRVGAKDRIAGYESFADFDLSPEVRSAVEDEIFSDMSYSKPTPVQRLAIPAILGQKKPNTPREENDSLETFLVAAETGSGKTLSYLLPAIDAVKKAEANDPELIAFRKRAEEEKARREQAGSRKFKPFDEPHPTMARPKVIVLVPSAELASQVAKVSKKLSHKVKFKTEMLSSDLKAQHIQRNLYGNKGVDVIVSTPHLLNSIAQSDPNILSRVSHLIIDEADSLFDRSFAPVTTSIIERATPSLKRLVCCSATIPRKLNNYLALTYPKMTRLTTPNLHAIPRRVQLGVIDVSREPYKNNKDLACADALYTIGKEGLAHEGPTKGKVDLRRVLVFVNEREKTEELAEFLRSKGIQADSLSRDTPEKRHGETLDMFTSNEKVEVDYVPSRDGRKGLPNLKALVVTDLASRGIDTLAVRHVILYDVPNTTIDFIHRLGRAGRMGRRGRGIVLVGNDDRKDVVADVKRSMFEGQALI